MRFHAFASVLALLASIAASSPISKRRTPVENSSLAHLEGLSGCYAKCMISEAHLYKFDMFTQSLADWCAETLGRWGHTQAWMSLHLRPCINKSYPRSKFNAEKSREWFWKHCPK